MFLKELQKRNKPLIDYVLKLKAENKIDPDTYVIDLEAIRENAQKLAQKASQLGIELYQMTKQFGRNPLVAQTIAQAGIQKAVCVDWKEAYILHQNGIKIGNIGHIVQVPTSQITKLLKMKPDVWTIYSLANAKELNKQAAKQKIKQKILLRVWSDQSLFYHSQHGGIKINDLELVIKELQKLKNLEIYGLTAFPVLLFNDKTNLIEPTINYQVMMEAKNIFTKLGLEVKNFNLPSCNNLTSLPLIKKLGGTSAEPGHAFTGTTPINSDFKNLEKPAMLYFSEVSHLHKNLIIAYAGGHYRRGHQKGALIGKDLKYYKFKPLANEAIDYYYEFINDQKQKINIGDPVIMAFRSQVFVTRSHVMVVDNLSQNNPKILGLFDSQGKKIA